MSNFELCDPCNPDQTTSLCTGDCSNNIWYQDGKCKLDQLTYEQVYWILQRNPNAKKDLLRATDDPTLVQLAQTTKLIQDPIEDGEAAAKMINNPKQTLPFYYLFRGNMNGNGS